MTTKDEKVVELMVRNERNERQKVENSGEKVMGFKGHVGWEEGNR